MGDKPHRNLGSVYTPPDFAQFLTRWAIQSPRQVALDIGVGEGAFTFALYERLRELGAKPGDASRQIYGAEIDHEAYGNFLRKAGLLYCRSSNFPVFCIPYYRLVTRRRRSWSLNVLWQAR